MKHLYQKPSITKDTLVHFESIYTASGATNPTIPSPIPTVGPPDCNGNHNNGNNGNHNGNHNGRPHRPGGRG